MSVKRIVDTNFWNDDKVIEYFSPEDKLFMLYLMTNPHTTQLGIYQINKKVMSFELGYSLDTVSVLLDRFENKYNMIKYSNETNEIAIKNYLKYSIIKGGKPVEDCLEKEIKLIKNKKLLTYVYENIINYSNLNETVKKIINKYNYNENDNDNDNEVSYHDTFDDTSTNIYSFIENNFNRTLSPIEYELVSQWEDNELTRYAIQEAVFNRAISLKYVQAILNNWKDKGITTIEQAKNNSKKIKSKVPSWLDQEIEKEEMTEEEEKAFRERLKMN